MCIHQTFGKGQAHCQFLVFQPESVQVWKLLFQAHFLFAGQTKYRKEGKRAREGSNTTFWNITHGDEPSTGKATYVPTDQETKFLLNARLGAPAQGELSQAFVSLD